MTSLSKLSQNEGWKRLSHLNYQTPVSYFFQSVLSDFVFIIIIWSLHHTNVDTFFNAPKTNYSLLSTNEDFYQSIQIKLLQYLIIDSI